MNKTEQFTATTAPIVARMKEEQAPYITAYLKAKEAYTAIVSDQAAIYAKVHAITNTEKYTTLHAAKMDALRAHDKNKVKEISEKLKAITDQANNLEQEAQSMSTPKEAAQIKKNLFAHEIIQIQARYCYDIVLAFTAIFCYEGLTSHSKKAKLIRETIEAAGVNLDYNYTIRPEGVHNCDRQSPSINIKTGKYNYSYSCTVLEPEETKAARDALPQPTPITEIETRAEIAAAALAMVRAERQRFIDNVRKLRPYINGTGLENDLEHNLQVTYFPK